jgi:hypothetical protein
MAVHSGPLKIKIAHQSADFVRGHPPLFTGIAVKLLSNGRVNEARRLGCGWHWLAEHEDKYDLSENHE